MTHKAARPSGVTCLCTANCFCGLVVEPEAALCHPFQLFRHPTDPVGKERHVVGNARQCRQRITGITQFADRTKVVLDPGADNGFRRPPHVEIGIERTRHAFDETIVFCNMISWVWVLISKSSVTSNSWVSRRAMEISLAS